MLQGSGIVVGDSATLLTLGKVFSPEGALNVNMLLSLLGLLIMAALSALNVKASLLLGIIITTAISCILGITPIPSELISTPPSIAPLLGQLDFSIIALPAFWGIVFTFFFVDFFDTLGTLVGVCNRSGLLDENGNLPRAKGALMADALATMSGALMGTSTVTSYVESSSGVAQGGRTGLTAITTALLFLIAPFFSPLVAIVPSAATSPALIIVGIYMMMSLRDLNYTDYTELIPSMLGFFMMPLAYSIATGIEFAIVSYTLLKLLTGRFKDINALLILLSVLFILKELFI